MRLKLLTVLCLGLFIWSTGCKNDKDDTPPITKDDDNGGGGNGCDTSFIPSYATRVLPILQNNCLGCHSAAGASGGIVLSNYTQAKNNAAKLIPSVNHPAGLPNSKKMPPGGKLNECDIVIINRWANSGFPE